MALTDDLIAYWAMDEASGTRVDSHGSNDLTDNNTVGSATGLISTAADFEASNSESLEIADNTDLSTGNIDCTWQFWFKLESTGGYYTLMSKAAANGNYEYWAYVTDASKLLFGKSDFGSAASMTTVTSTETLSSGVWYHAILYHDAAADEIGMIIDDGTPTTSATSTGIHNGTSPFCIGRYDDFDQAYFDGLIDEVGFWKRMLTGAEVTELYNSGAGLAYPFTGGDSSIIQLVLTNIKGWFSNMTGWFSN